MGIDPAQKFLESEDRIAVGRTFGRAGRHDEAEGGSAQRCQHAAPRRRHRLGGDWGNEQTGNKQAEGCDQITGADLVGPGFITPLSHERVEDG